MDEKKLATKHVPTESNIAEIGTKGLTSDGIWKLMNQMAMRLVAGVECLVQHPMVKITETSIPDRGMNQTMRLSWRELAGQWLAKTVPMKWQGPGASRQCNVTAVKVSTKRVGG